MERGALKAAVSTEASTLSIPGFLSQPVIDMMDSQGFFDGLAQRIKLNARTVWRLSRHEHGWTARTRNGRL